jgi:hypothetical protein
LLIDFVNNSIEKRFNISRLQNEREFPFGRVFILNDSLLLAFNQGEDTHNDGVLNSPLYRMFNYRTNEELAKYEIYNSFGYNKKLMPPIYDYVSFYLWTCVDDEYIFAVLNNNDVKIL